MCFATPSAREAKLLNEIGTPCEYLTWDSEFFGHRIARVTSHRLNLTQLMGVETWCAHNAIDCLYFLADSDDDETTFVAEQSAFHLVDVRMTLALRDPASVTSPSADAASRQSIVIRTVRSSDVLSLETIARTAHEDSRFYFDRRFSRSRCSNLYATWIRRSCEGFADQVLIAEYAQQVAGYITCTCVDGEDPHGFIGLVGVTSAARGMGIGPALVTRSLRWFAEQGVQEVEVVTQGRNIAAQRMYQRCGFASQSLRLWYHRWFTHDRRS